MEEQSPKIIEYAELLLQEEKKQEARLLLVAYIKHNPASAHAWWVLSQAVEDARQELDCLERVLRLDPVHEQARLRVTELKAPPEPELTLVPPPVRPASPVVSPFVLSENEPKAEEDGFDLFLPDAFQQAAVPSFRASRPAAALEPEAREMNAVPAWAEPPSSPQGSESRARSAPRKKRTWVVDAIVISVILCALLVLVSYFIWIDLGHTVVRDIQATQEVARILTSNPPKTLEPTWTASATFTPIPSEMLTPTFTPFTPTITSTLLYTLTKTGIPSSAVGVTAGRYPPDFSLVDVATGAQVSLGDYVGQPILIFFWATWCPYCNDEIPTLQDIHAAYQDDGLVLLAVNVGDSFAEVDAYRNAHGLSFPMLLDPDYDISLRYKANSIPHHVFIGVNGKIMFVVTGELSYSELENKVKATLRVFPTSTP